MKMSDRVSSIKYAIRDLLPIAEEVASKGHEIIKLNIGDPIRFDYEIPAIMQKALIEAVSKGFCGRSEGELELIKAIQAKEKMFNGFDIAKENILVGSGVSELISFTLAALSDPGDRVLLPDPCYPAYQGVANFLGLTIDYYSCDEANDWQPNVDSIKENLHDNTKALVLINPNNPTGAVYSPRVLKEIGDAIAPYNIPIISDEIYDLLTIEKGLFHSTPNVIKDIPIIRYNGFSKVYLAPGWRVGYATLHDPNGEMKEPWEGAAKMTRVRLSSCTPIQHACAAGATNIDHLPSLLEKIEKRRNVVVNGVNDIEELSIVSPKAAFYSFPRIDLSNLNFKDDQEFVIGLLKEEHVLLVHGSGFGPKEGKDHFRLVYLANEEILSDAMEKIKRFIIKNRV